MSQEPLDSTLLEKRKHSRARRAATPIIALLLGYLLVAYLLMPSYWRVYAHRHPSFEDIPRITYTSDDHPGDPLNVALVGTEEEVRAIMQAAKWYPADKLGLRSDLRIGVDTVLERPYDKAPVSKLFLREPDGKLRMEDLAFEKPVGDDPKKRNHVRFWKTDKPNPNDGRPQWIGSASFDERVGLSDTTGQITHHISGDVDAERDLLLNDLKQTGLLLETYFVDGFHTILTGKNGGGDPWRTDGRLAGGIIEGKKTPAQSP